MTATLTQRFSGMCTHTRVEQAILALALAYVENLFVVDLRSCLYAFIAVLSLSIYSFSLILFLLLLFDCSCLSSCLCIEFKSTRMKFGFAITCIYLIFFLRNI